MADDIQTRAVEYVDRIHKVQRQALFDGHRMHEQTELARRKAELQDFKRQHDRQGDRYNARTEQIEQRRERARLAIQQRHDSFAGRLQGMTKAGRAKQRDEYERLTTRAEQLHARAYNQYSQSSARLQNSEYKARDGHARAMKQIRADNYQYREQQSRQQEQARPRQVEYRSQLLREVANEQLRQAMRQEQTRQQQPGRTR